MFRYEKMTSLWFRNLRDFNSAKEFVGCSWVRRQISEKGFEFHKEFTNFSKLFAKKDKHLLLSCSLLLFRHDLSILLLPIKDKPLDVHRLWIFSLILFISSLKSWSYLLIKLDLTTLGFLCVSHPSIYFNKFFNFFCLSHLKYRLFHNVKWWHQADDVISALYHLTCQYL